LAALFAAALFVPAVFAQPMGNGPKYDKYVASLEYDDVVVVRFGQVIFNTNLEDEGYELEVEVEECLELANSTVEVKLNSVLINTLDIDEDGNGKATFHVEAISTDDMISVEGIIVLDSGDWRLWYKIKGPK
jgi:hypothetical protein